ncbi:collagen alpha-3(VI) chain [Rhincodon typus]|uniref:collagen alpha-3(VI) chain n=1 Tax=Rhincodon typus TaxID=259920 RepID=UPI00202FF2F6|nr:collagen alpha-3(VI) chain [Rhincodon typus]
MFFNVAQFEAILIGLLFASLTSTSAQQPACRESSLADIVFLVDGSWSIGIQNFKNIQEFLYTLVNGFDVGLDKVRIGLIQYSGNPRTEFFLNSYSDKNEILQYLQQLPYKGGGTRTGLGLKFMLNKHFVESAGSRASMGVPQVAIVITDGQSQDSVGPPAKALRDRGVTIYAIGIKDAVEKELEEIASKPAGNYVYNVADFAALRGISQAVIQFVCTRVEEVTRQVSQVSQVSPACRKATLADIVLVVDSSTSISDENFEEVREFLYTFVSGLDIAENKVRIGLVQYSDDPKTEFLLNQYSSKNDILNYLQSLQQKKGRTDTRRALEFLQSQHFVPAAGSRAADNVQQIVILVTDGESITEVDDAANRLRNSGVTIYVVGVNIQGKKELQDISSRPVQRYTYHVANFLGMKEISNKILESVCKTVEAHIQAFAVRYADIVFLVDGSQNMEIAGFQQIRSFIFKIISQLDIGANKYRIGLAQYDTSARTEFLLNTYITKIQVANYIRSDSSFTFQGGPGLAMGRAIDFVRRTFFRESAGSRKGEGVPQIVIIVTSAPSQDDITLPARALKKEGVKVISVGVRRSILSELQRVAFLPNFPFVFQISAFDALIQSSEQISNAIRQLVRREFRYREMRRPPVCQSASVADIVFLVDESDSIGAVNFQLLRVFLHNMINALEVEAESVHVGLAQYSANASEDFNLKMYLRKSDILDHIKSIRYGGGGRNTGVAIDFVRNNYFMGQAGSRARKGFPQILIVITSGKSQDAVKDSAATLRRLGVTLYVLGIQNATESELKKIASHPSKNYVSTVEDFTQLSTIEDMLQKKICNEIIKQTTVQSVRVKRLKQGCVETEEADIFFLVDGSDSISPEELMDMKRFLVDVVNVFSIGADQVRVGVVQYADSPRIEIGITQHTSQTDLEKAIKQISQMGGGMATGRALTYMRNLLSNAVTSRRQRVRHILITITSGQSDDPVRSPAAELRRQGVDTFAIGVGNTDESELLQIGGTRERIFYVTNFDALKDVKNNIVRELCSREACRKLDMADIIFLIDGSGSINTEDFRKMKTFMDAIVNKTSIEDKNVHIGLIQFASSPKLEFELNVHSRKADLLTAISNMQQLGGGTLTGRALRFAVDYFDEAKGGRPNVPQYLIVITDGEAQDEVLQPAKALRDKGVTVFTVGVFNANSTQLLEVGGAWDKVHYVENFDLLDTPEKQILWEICSQPEVCLRTEAADILFVIDGSGNVQPYDFERMKRFVMTLVNSSEVSPSRVRFGAILYNNDPDIQFQLSQFRSKNEVRQAISQMQMKEGPTFTARALQQARKLLTLEKGSRQMAGVSQFVIVITDEEAADSSAVPGVAEDIREDGVTVLAVGIAEANKRELEAIGGSRENYFYVQDFDALKNITRDLLLLVCTNTNPECDLQQADIVFLVDGSESIMAEDFSYIKSFMKSMVSFFSIVPSMFQFGLAQFSTSFRKEFDLKDFPDKKTLMAEIEKMVQLNQGTRIGPALMNVTRLFTREAGSRKASNVPQFLVVITDGRSKESVMGPADNLRDNGIEILTVGVGQADLKQLLQISGSRDRIYFVDSFRDLGKIKQRIVRSLCEDQPGAGCTIDVAVGVDLPSQARFSNALGSQLNLQMQQLDSLIQRMTDLHNISCIAGHSFNVRAGFHITDRVGRIRFESDFESYNLDVLRNARSFLLSAMDQISLTADYLLSFANKFERESGKNVKVIVMFTNGVADSMNRLKEASNRLRLNGVNALITVALENTANVDELHELDFGRGFGYNRKLAIGMHDIGGVLHTEIDTVAERECCDIICKCFGQMGKHGQQGEQGIKGISGPLGALGYAGEDGGMGERGPPGIIGPRGAEGCQGTRGLMGERGYRGEKGETADNGAPGTNGEQGKPGIPGIAGPKGDNGNTGSKGPPGFKGERGDVGIPGDPGTPGQETYARGYPGERGNPGVPGERGGGGTPGFRGSKGNNGRPGRRGLVGKTGVRGLSGYPGSIGPSGLHGQQGSAGTVGLEGVKGERGLPGIPGAAGLFGFKGAKGNQGLQGGRVRGTIS